MAVLASTVVPQAAFAGKSRAEDAVGMRKTAFPGGGSSPLVTLVSRLRISTSLRISVFTKTTKMCIL